MTVLDCAGKSLDLSQPRVMGILNVTPDSFSDGGDFVSPRAALERARRMVGEGADIIDVGGESTRPGAQPVSEDAELERVIPVIEAITEELSVVVSIDTSKPGNSSNTRSPFRLIRDPSWALPKSAVSTAPSPNL